MLRASARGPAGDQFGLSRTGATTGEMVNGHIQHDSLGQQQLTVFGRQRFMDDIEYPLFLRNMMRDSMFRAAPVRRV